MTSVCVVTIGLVNGRASVRCKDINWNNGSLLSIRPLEIKCNVILIEMQIISSTKMLLKMFAMWHEQCPL